MPRTVERKTEKKPEAKPKVQNMESLIETQIHERMGGKPQGHWRTIVKHLWDNNYRVNVFCEIQPFRSVLKGSDVTDPMESCRRITNSFFVRTDENGQIVSCDSGTSKSKK